MKISWNHLQNLFDDQLDKTLVLERLTMAGLEVEDENPIAPQFSGVVVGQVVECNKHPDADKLSLCKVDIGQDELLSIICGATNVAVGIKIPCATIGAVLPNNFIITERKMRGIISYGMLCAGDELGCPNGVDGLLILPADAPLGMDIRQYLDLDDLIIEFKITPNRGDCLSYRGLAREVAALTNYKLKSVVNYSLPELDASDLQLLVEANNECPNYAGLVMHQINNQHQSPLWLQRQLERSGIRPINPLVDIGNYVMLELGQPLHIFDLNAIGGQIKVRLAQENEQITLLDDKTVKLTADSLIITNYANQAVAIAGVMGSLNSGVSSITQAIVIESASFDPQIIQGKAKYYGVSSEAAFRFERGVDPQITKLALALAQQLVSEICGGQIDQQINFTNPHAKLFDKPVIELTWLEISRLIGQELPQATITQILLALGCQVTSCADKLQLTVPSYRFDLKIKQDIIEEIIRVYGYDRIEAKLPVLAQGLNYLDPKLTKTNLIKQILVGYGFSEIISYAFIEEKYAKLFANNSKYLVKLQNSIAGLAVMRDNLVAGLIKSLQYNVNRGQDSIRLFEVARVFNGEDIAQQPINLAGLIYGFNQAKTWNMPPREVDFYDLSMVVQQLLEHFGSVKITSAQAYPYMHPGRCGEIHLNNQAIGYIWQLHPQLLAELGLTSAPYLFEIKLDQLEFPQVVKSTSVSKFQKVTRDLAFILDKQIEVGQIIQQINLLHLTELTSCNVFDIFSGGNLASHQKSVAFNLVFQANRTLTDEDINPSLEQIKQLVIENFGGSLR
jgi:phenylalanyl-tRNA synthetase beta chain